MPFLEPSVSISERVDGVFLLAFVLAVTVLIVITFLMVYFVVKYRRTRNPKATDVEGHTPLEVGWTLVTLVLFLVIFYYGWTNFRYMRNPPRDAMVVEATGRQWAWSFRYPNGKQAEEMYVALDRPVKVELRSQDVLHGFYIPAFRVKADVVPGKTNFLWFTPTILGTFDVQCTVMCGVQHSYMLSKVHVLSEDDFKEWYFGSDTPGEGERAAAASITGSLASASTPGIQVDRTAGTLSAAAPAAATPAGLAVLEAGDCLVCHSIDGERMVGPSFKGVLGRKEIVVVVSEEVEVVVNEAYLRRAIREPNEEIVKGYPPSMPVNRLTDQEIEEVIAYLKTLT